MSLFKISLIFLSLISSKTIFSSEQLSDLISSHSSKYANSDKCEPLELPGAHFVSEPITLQNSKHVIVGVSDTILSPQKTEASSSLLSLANATLSLHTVTFSPEQGSLLISVDESSVAKLSGINIFMSGVKGSLFNVDSGALSFHSLQLDKIYAPVNPLISCSKIGATLSLEDTSLQSFTTRGPETLFGNKNAYTVTVKNSQFKNVTMDNSFALIDAYAGHQMCSSISCIFETTDNAYQGNIIAGLHSANFQAFNNTHINDDTIHRERVLVSNATSTSTFSSEQFSHCQAESDNGGAISLRYYGSVTVSDCTFQTCRVTGLSTFGGAISTYGYHGESLTVSDSTFTNCSSVQFGGAIASEGTTTISGCNFTECKSQFGGGVSLNLVTADSSLSSLVFDQCSTDLSGKGGAIYVYRVNGSSSKNITLSFSDIKFNKCTATANAGGIYFSGLQISSHSFYVFLTFTNLKFIKSKVSSGVSGHGKDIGAEEGWWFCIQDISFTDCESDSSRPHISIRTATSDEYETHDDWMEDNGPMRWWVVLIIVGSVLVVLIICAIVCSCLYYHYVYKKAHPQTEEGEEQGAEDTQPLREDTA